MTIKSDKNKVRSSLDELEVMIRRQSTRFEDILEVDSLSRGWQDPEELLCQGTCRGKAVGSEQLQSLAMKYSV